MPADTAPDERYSDANTTLRILDAVERDGDQNQRAMAGEAGVALGLANAYLRRCARKGWIKMREAPARRYLYYITPQGFAEKARLTAEYLTSSFEMFRAARGECDKIMESCKRQGRRRIALWKLKWSRWSTLNRTSPNWPVFRSCGHWMNSTRSTPS
jgi:DNA-binding MarR family transcriptional regulator